MARARLLLLSLLAATLLGCTHAALEDCPDGAVLGSDVHRLRTLQYRTRLGHPPAAAERFVQLAAMSALAYRDAERCHADAADNPVQPDEVVALARLLEPGPAQAPWRRRSFSGAALPDACEDDTGLLLHVWQRAGAAGQPDDVVIAFRGTSGFRDWPYGNLWWFTRFLLRDNQYARTAGHVRAIVEELAAAARSEGKPFPRIVATGHSLGGGLAQHALYSRPGEVLQAVVFDPSAVTAFVDTDSEEAALGCSCRGELGVESRILRVYESDEILANLRIFHKILFPPHLHIQEVRFAIDHGRDPVGAHSMKELALGLDALRRLPGPGAAPARWWESDDPRCSRKVEDAQRAACAGRAVPACVRTQP